MPGAVLTIIFVCTALIGLVTAWLGWRGRNPGTTRWCPQCELDMSATESKTCTRCGFSSTTEHAFHIRRHRWGVVIIGLSVTAVSSLGAGRSGLGPAANRLFVPAWELEERLMLGRPTWVAEVRRSSEPGRTSMPARVRVFRDGIVQFEWMGQFASLGAYASGRSRWGVGDDIDGDGTPNLVIETRGMDAIDRTYVFSLATEDGSIRLEPVAILQKGRFEDLDEDGRPEYLLEDETYQYRLGGMYGGPRPTLVCVPDGRGGWRVDAEKSMARPMPDDWQEQFARDRAASVGAGQSGNVAAHGMALQLLYRGRTDELDSFLQRAFADSPDQIQAFHAAVASSPFNHHLKAMSKE